MSTIASYSPLNISETVRDRPRGLVPKDLSIGYGQLSLSAHVAAVATGIPTVELLVDLSKCLYYQLRQLRQAVRSLSEDASKTLV